MDDTEIYALLSSPASKRKVENLVKKLKEPDEDTKKQQRLGGTILFNCVCFGTVLENYPTLSARLDPDARIPHFWVRVGPDSGHL